MKDSAVFLASQPATSARASKTSASAHTAPPAVVCAADLVRSVPLLGRDYRFSPRQLEGAEPVLHGEFETLALRPGLVLHRTCVRDLHDMQTSLTLAPGLKIGLLVAGETELSYGSLDLHLGPRRDRQGRLHNPGSIVALAEPDTFSRRWRRGRRETKVSVTLLPEWLDNGAFPESDALDRVREFRQRHLANERWQPSARAQALAHQIARPPELTEPFRSWYLEARTIEFAAEALGAIAQASPPEPPRLTPREHQRLRELQAWLDVRANAALSLDDIAREAAMSPTALQRAFRAYSGQSLFDYLRARRLDAARQALERDGVSVAQAADLAGYAGAHNFATAFKRRFGCSPSRVRLRV